jgi:hypothetical protein
MIAAAPITPEPFVQHGNVYFVPVIRQRLNFAVLVQRAVGRLGLNDEDVIAVALPNSLREPLAAALAKLPFVSLIIASLDAAKLREVFPVTPCDGMVEAIRIATERKIPFECIDREIAPGHLRGRSCIRDFDWPDDGLALHLGAREYLSMVETSLSQPPVRSEPVDSWRESAMAQRLRELAPRHRFVLVVCDAANVSGIARLLSVPAGEQESPAESNLRPKLRVVAPNLAALLTYLDDYPRLVEIYEQYRRDGRAAAFDKTAALIENICGVERQAADIHFSLREFQTFTQYLNNLLALNRRVCPQPFDLHQACASCFDRPFAERLHVYLAGYGRQLKVDRVGRLSDTREPLFLMTQTLDGAEHFVARSCNPTPSYYVVAPGPPRTRKLDSDTYLHGWPPFEEYLNKMRRKAHILAIDSQRISKRTVFRGSVEDGVDSKWTLRSIWRGSNAIYVKQLKRNQKPLRDVRLEPIVWLFDLTPSDKHSLRLWITGGGADEPVVGEWLYYSTEPMPLYEAENVTISFRDVRGYLTFCDAASGVRELRTLYANTFESRIPKQDDFEYVPHLGSIPEGTIEDFPNALWWEAMLLTGLRYCSKVLVCALPDGSSISPRVLAFAAHHGKRILRISLSQFGHRERRKLTANYVLSIPGYDPSRELNDPEFIRYRVENYSRIMERFWAA